MGLFSNLSDSVTRKLGSLFFKAKKASPEICVIGGIACGIGAVALVGVKSWKHRNELELDLDGIRPYTTEFVEVDEESEKTLTKKEEKKIVVRPDGQKLLPKKIRYKDLTDVQKKQLWARRLDLTKDIVKIYWIPVALGASSIGLVWGGRTMLRKELSAVTAAYATLLETYRRYREKVKEVVGAEKEEQIALGYEMLPVADAKTGEIKKVAAIDRNANLSQYGFWFDEGIFDKATGQWGWRNFTHDRDKIHNRLKVVELQNEYTRRIRTIGYAWLEDLALDFGIDPDEARKFHDIGWVWKEGSENRVELGVLESKWQLEVNKAFTDDRLSQNVCFINPNVDGYIGYVRDDYAKYDFRYGRGKREAKSINRKFNELILRRNQEQMENMIIEATMK